MVKPMTKWSLNRGGHKSRFLNYILYISPVGHTCLLLRDPLLLTTSQISLCPPGKFGSRFKKA